MGCEKRKEEALLFTASESEASEEERTLIYLTHSESADSFTNQAAQEFTRALEEISAGSFDVEIYPEDTLGSVKEFSGRRVLGIWCADHRNASVDVSCADK